MRFLKRVVAALFVLLLGAAAGLYIYFRKELRIPQAPPEGAAIVEIPRGAHVRDVVHLLHDRNIVRNEYIALGYLLVTGGRHKLRAGEYMFDHPMTVPEVVNKLLSGAIYLHKFTVPEGLTLDGVAQKWEEQGFGKADDFVHAAAESISLIRDLDDQSQSIEGYLFPETYSFPIRTTPRQAINAMVNRFRTVIGKLQEKYPQEQWPLNLRQTVILASLVESEAAHDEERGLIGGVYLNRLMRHILLQCDPTVVYGLAQSNQYHGTLTLKDLKFESPYNTYVHPGLPPGPIMNPGYPSLEAAVNPTMSNLLYFVRTTEGRHTFSETLDAHNRAVAQYRAQKAREAHHN
jgi:UPF0755 protein